MDFQIKDIKDFNEDVNTNDVSIEKDVNLKMAKEDVKDTIVKHMVKVYMLVVELRKNVPVAKNLKIVDVLKQMKTEGSIFRKLFLAAWTEQEFVDKFKQRVGVEVDTRIFEGIENL